MNMLSIQNLHAAVHGTAVLHGIQLEVQPGEVHAIMGPNGSGKSTLVNLLAGRPHYQVTAGQVRFQDQDLLTLTPDARARLGVFLAFQYPIEIPGVNNSYFLKSALNHIRKERGLAPLDALDFMKEIRQLLKLLDMDEKFLQREVNVGFSGGEKKRNEVLQMLLMQPQLALLDETDSGLDIDALQIVAKGVNALRSANRSIVLITHYQRLLEYVIPDRVHVLANGKIIKSGGPELALALEQKGYGWLQDAKVDV